MTGETLGFKGVGPLIMAAAESGETAEAACGQEDEEGEEEEKVCDLDGAKKELLLEGVGDPKASGDRDDGEREEGERVGEREGEEEEETGRNRELGGGRVTSNS